MTDVVDYSPNAGGAEITSFNLEYNNGAGTTFVEVVGFTTEQLETEVTVSTTPGLTYLFRYRVKNIFGFSGYSPQASIKSAKAPSQPLSVMTSISGENVLIEWVPADDNYDEVLRFEIIIQRKDGSWSQET
jgi:hypothetical protein